MIHVDDDAVLVNENPLECRFRKHAKAFLAVLEGIFSLTLAGKIANHVQNANRRLIGSPNDALVDLHGTPEAVARIIRFADGYAILQAVAGFGDETVAGWYGTMNQDPGILANGFRGLASNQFEELAVAAQHAPGMEKSEA